MSSLRHYITASQWLLTFLSSPLSLPSAVTHLRYEGFVPPQLPGALLPYLWKLSAKNWSFLILELEHSHTKQSAQPGGSFGGEGFICTASAALTSIALATGKREWQLTVTIFSLAFIFFFHRMCILDVLFSQLPANFNSSSAYQLLVKPFIAGDYTLKFTFTFHWQDGDLHP